MPSSTAPASGHQPSKPGRGRRILAYRVLLGIALAVILLDQISKLLIIHRLPLGSYGPGHDIVIIPGFFHLVHVGNTGAAWSLLAGKSLWLAVAAIATLCAIFVWRRALGLRHRTAQIAFGLLCGGIIGNLVDRLQHGHVVDFLDFHFGSYVYPTFNIADSCICIGVALYFWHSLRAQPDHAGKP